MVGNPPQIGCKAPCEDVKCGLHAYCKADGAEAYCVCDEGWTYNPSDISAGCIDINECDTSHGPSGRCGLNSICTNTPGDFSCKFELLFYFLFVTKPTFRLANQMRRNWYPQA